MGKELEKDIIRCGMGQVRMCCDGMLSSTIQKVYWWWWVGMKSNIVSVPVPL